MHPLRNALVGYRVTFGNNVANLVTLMLRGFPSKRGDAQSFSLSEKQQILYLLENSMVFVCKSVHLRFGDATQEDAASFAPFLCFRLSFLRFLPKNSFSSTRRNFILSPLCLFSSYFVFGLFLTTVYLYNYLRIISLPFFIKLFAARMA